MTKICKNCSQNFIIQPDDTTFYKKIGVPEPTFCPDCRLQRRLAWRNDLVFYNRECDLCHKKIISLYHPAKKLTVYCNTCWWSDKWDPTSYGKDYDFSRRFFEQYRELQDRVPLPALFNDDGVGSMNCKYTQNTTFAKNCYMVAMTWKGEDIFYSYHVNGIKSRDLMDVLEIFGYCENVYDSIALEHCYNCRNCYYSSGLVDCAFCYDCKGSSNCFMCVNLRNAEYCILNKKYTKKEYEEKIKSYRLDTDSGQERAIKEFLEFLTTQPRRYARFTNCTNCTGDVLFNCKNVKDSMWAVGCEDVRYMWRGTSVKDSYDISPSGECSLTYEGLTPDHDSRVLFSIYSLKSQDLTYVENCHSSKDLFGCSSIKHGQYMILNKQYNREDYFVEITKIKHQMTKNGEWGEFFPAKLSHFGYNETMAQEYFPLEREKALAAGFMWWDNIQKTEGKETLKPEQIPDSINDVNEAILDEILACIKCHRNYKIVKDELTFYQKHGIPIPRKCFYCRNSDRLKLENPFRLWHRKCAKCDNKFETSYSPDRPEIVYCEGCYNKEII